jgi:hypothetical protein
MARNKKGKKEPTDSVTNLLGEGFGLRTRVVARSSKSFDDRSSGRRLSSRRSISPASPLIAMSASFPQPLLPAQPQLPPQVAYSTPLPQTGFMPNVTPPEIQQMQAQLQYLQMQVAHLQMPHISQEFPLSSQSQQEQQPLQVKSKPTRYAVDLTPPEPTKEDFEDLVRIDAHFNALENEEKIFGKPPSSAATLASSTNVDKPASEPPAAIAKHVCAGCGNIRSTHYHHENPIKFGETPAPSFCRKCQIEATSSESEMLQTKDKGGKGKSKVKEKHMADRKDGVDYIFVEEQSSEEELFRAPRKHASSRRKEGGRSRYVFM